MNKQPQRTKSPMKTGRITRTTSAPTADNFNFLAAKQELEVGKDSAGHKGAGVNARKKVAKKV